MSGATVRTGDAPRASGMSLHDPQCWPLAPGNAPENYERAFAKQADSYKMPLDPWQYDLLRGIFGRAERRKS